MHGDEIDMLLFLPISIEMISLIILDHKDYFITAFPEHDFQKVACLAKVRVDELSGLQ